MGVTLRHIGGIGGGVRRQTLGLQPGGPSGGAPESLLDLPIDYGSLAEASSVMFRRPDRDG
jgi:NADH:ubiquinone oxidoreductase subunit F (NADH-binding)